MTVSVRLLPRDRQDTLYGYVFADNEHAREWLTQPFVDRGAYKLEKVEVGELHRCRFCDGSGVRQSIKSIATMTVEEFLAPGS
jgi:hypothetical protein